MNKTRLDLLGKVFGRLTVVGVTDQRDNSGCVKWDCQCECGNRLFVIGTSLRTGNTQSCGCLKKERFTNRKHGRSKTLLYGVWTEMLQRCYNPRNKKYSHYGKRGIAVCEEWRHDFEAFSEWALRNGYEVRFGKDRLTIDRRDNDKGYGPDNCRWVGYHLQNCNRRLKSVMLGAPQ